MLEAGLRIQDLLAEYGFVLDYGINIDKPAFLHYTFKNNGRRYIVSYKDGGYEYGFGINLHKCNTLEELKDKLNVTLRDYLKGREKHGKESKQ